MALGTLMVPVQLDSTHYAALTFVNLSPHRNMQRFSLCIIYEPHA